MARYTGPATRKSRRLRVDLVGGDMSFERRPYPPGQAGRARILSAAGLCAADRDGGAAVTAHAGAWHGEREAAIRRAL